MAQEPKLLKDWSAEVKVAVPAITEPAYKEPSTIGAALDALLAWEKKTRLAADSWSTAHIAQAIVKLCGDLKQWRALNDQIHLLAKRRAQLKKTIQTAVQEAMLFLDATPDQATKLELIETLRTVAAGKIYVEIELARLTMTLAKIKEAQGNVGGACETLQEIQVETVGSMEAPEKIDFLLEQMRLCLDHHDYVRAELTAEKVSKKLLNHVDNQERKLRYHRLMIRFYQKKSDYLSCCKSYRAIFDTPLVQADAAQWRDALTHAAVYLVLAPFDAEVSDMLQRIKAEKKLADLPSCERAYALFTTHELCAWPLPFDAEWRAHAVFQVAAAAVGEDGDARWRLLQKRVVQHNIRVISKYYARIGFARLAQLLSLDEATAEEYLCEVVASKQVAAKIDRPAAIVVFAAKPDANRVLNEWAHDVGQLLALVEESCHMINKEQMLHAIAAE